MVLRIAGVIDPAGVRISGRLIDLGWAVWAATNVAVMWADSTLSKAEAGVTHAEAIAMTWRHFAAEIGFVVSGAMLFWLVRRIQRTVNSGAVSASSRSASAPHGAYAHS